MTNELLLLRWLVGLFMGSSQTLANVVVVVVVVNDNDDDDDDDDTVFCCCRCFMVRSRLFTLQAELPQAGSATAWTCALRRPRMPR